MKIINVFDTREYVQGPDDKWFPIPGSGDLNICDRCGKGHEVHYHIEIDGNQKVVGGGCAKKDGLITETQHKSLGSASVTLAKNQSKLKFLLAQKKIQDEIWNQVDKLEVPEIEKGEFKDFGCGERQTIATWKLGEEKVTVFHYTGNSESAIYNNQFNIKNSTENLQHSWKLKRMMELAPVGFKQVSEYEIDQIKHQVKRAEKKIQKLMEIK